MDLTRTHRWEPFYPELGENRELPEEQRLTIQIASGLTAQQLADFSADLQAMKQTPESMAEAFAKVARIVGEQPTVIQRPITCLRDYFELLLLLSPGGAMFHLQELSSTVIDFNSVGGASKLFWRRRSGGQSSTPARNAAPATAVPPAGKPTSVQASSATP